ncbi:hypothetical protein AVEN_164456-1, partial [Araneus ventricosus]
DLENRRKVYTGKTFSGQGDEKTREVPKEATITEVKEEEEEEEGAVEEVEVVDDEKDKGEEAQKKHADEEKVADEEDEEKAAAEDDVEEEEVMADQVIVYDLLTTVILITITYYNTVLQDTIARVAGRLENREWSGNFGRRGKVREIYSKTGNFLILIACDNSLIFFYK